MKEKYYVFKLRFMPEPMAQGGQKEFDTLEDAQNYIENPTENIPGQAWLFVKKPIVGNTYEFIKLINIIK